MDKQALKLQKKLYHYAGKAIADYDMIKKGDRVLVCLSGGKDSWCMLHILNHLRIVSHNKFSIRAFILDQRQPGWDNTALKAYLTEHGFDFDIVREDTYKIVIDKVPEGKTYCSLCSRLRRGIIYRYAEDNGFNKVALGHHRDDLIQSLLMSIMYNGRVQSMPPKLLSDNKRHIVIRPLVYCQENDLRDFARAMAFPIIPCNLCGSQDNLMRQRVKALLLKLADENPKIPSNMLHALQSVKPSQLMDKSLWDFKGLEALMEPETTTQD